MHRYMRSVTPADINYLAEHMREEDVAEIFAASGVTPLEALEEGVAASAVAFTLHVEGTVVAIGGVTQDPTDAFVGHIWLLGTPAVDEFAFRFLRHSRDLADALNRKWPQLTNWVDSRNRIHLKWLHWLGFKFIAKEEIGAPGVPFLQFVRVAPDV